jgi:hypothetical protein
MPIFGTWINPTNGGTASAIPPTWTSAQPTSVTNSATSALNYQTATATGTPSAFYQAMANQAVVGGGLVGAGTSNWYYTEETGWMDAQAYYALAQNRVAYYREQTAEDLRLMEEARAQAVRAQEEYIRKTREALDRSRELLLSHLTPEQRKTFEKNQWFVVEGGKTKVKYRINTNTYAGNIHVLVGSKVSHRLCVHCEGVPLHDHHLAQKLWLEHDEERILKIANRQAA